MVLALRLLEPAGTLARIAEDLAVAPSQIHASLRRLELAGLLKPEQRSANSRVLLEFLLGGLRYVFPAVRGSLRDGIPTAYSAPPLNAVVDAIDVVVWPAAKQSGAVRGFSIVPLYPRAPLLVTRAPTLYRRLTIVDALRLGDPRVRTFARQALEQELSGTG